MTESCALVPRRNLQRDAGSPCCLATERAYLLLQRCGRSCALPATLAMQSCCNTCIRGRGQGAPILPCYLCPTLQRREWSGSCSPANLLPHSVPCGRIRLSARPASRSREKKHISFKRWLRSAGSGKRQKKRKGSASNSTWSRQCSKALRRPLLADLPSRAASHDHVSRCFPQSGSGAINLQLCAVSPLWAKLALPFVGTAVVQPLCPDIDVDRFRLAAARLSCRRRHVKSFQGALLYYTTLSASSRCPRRPAGVDAFGGHYREGNLLSSQPLHYCMLRERSFRAYRGRVWVARVQWEEVPHASAKCRPLAFQDSKQSLVLPTPC